MTDDLLLETLVQPSVLVSCVFIVRRFLSFFLQTNKKDTSQA